MKDPRVGKSPLERAREKLEEKNEVILDHSFLPGLIGDGESDVSPSEYCPLSPAPEIVIVKRTEAKERVGVIAIPTRVAEKSRPCSGIVVAVGKSCHWTLQVNQTILFYEFGMTPFYYDGVEYLAVKMMDVICSVKDHETKNSS